MYEQFGIQLNSNYVRADFPHKSVSGASQQATKEREKMNKKSGKGRNIGTEKDKAGGKKWESEISERGKS